MKTGFSSRVCFTPSFKGNSFIWGAKNGARWKLDILNITHISDLASNLVKNVERNSFKERSKINTKDQRTQKY